MLSLANTRQAELFLTVGADNAEAKAIQRLAKKGDLVRLVEGVYIAEKDNDAQMAIVRRNWQRILGALVPGGVVSYRSAYTGGLAPDGTVFISHPTRYNRTIELPGLRATLVKGPGALPGDMPLGKQLYFASRERQLLENLTRSRGEHGRSMGEQAVEERLVAILNASGEQDLNEIRDSARALAASLKLEKSFQKLDELIGALLATKNAGNLKTKEGQLAAKGTPVYTGRLERFEKLALQLRAAVLPRRAAIATEEPARSNFAFVEAYFSNYVEGTEFGIEEARDIALMGRIVESRPKDSHDILGVFQLALHSPGRDTVPPVGPEFPEELRRRHARMLEKRPEANPGQFKLARNRAGNTWFVDPGLVPGTLIEGSLIAQSIPEGIARAIYYAFLISEIHPFADGNGRLARLIMNAELSRVQQARIIIPTLFHEEYVDCQRQLSRDDDPKGHIRALELMQRWTVAFDYTDTDRLIAALTRTNALERSRSEYRLTMPDGGPVQG